MGLPKVLDHRGPASWLQLDSPSSNGAPHSSKLPQVSWEPQEACMKHTAASENERVLPQMAFGCVGLACSFYALWHLEQPLESHEPGLRAAGTPQEQNSFVWFVPQAEGTRRNPRALKLPQSRVSTQLASFTNHREAENMDRTQLASWGWGTAQGTTKYYQVPM